MAEKGEKEGERSGQSEGGRAGGGGGGQRVRERGGRGGQRQWSTVLTSTPSSVLQDVHERVVKGVTELVTIKGGHLYAHTPSTAFRPLPPDSARFSYATEGVLFISAQLSSDAVSALRKVSVLI